MHTLHAYVFNLGSPTTPRTLLLQTQAPKYLWPHTGKTYPYASLLNNQNSFFIFHYQIKQF